MLRETSSKDLISSNASVKSDKIDDKILEDDYQKVLRSSLF